jgi:L-alanine-DL-glutamate epimerase-like enolase superfamily enzyme
MGSYSNLASLRLEIDECVLEPLEQGVSGAWTRRTTVVRLRGGGLDGVGEDVNYEAAEQAAFQAAGAHWPLAGTYTLDELSHLLDTLDLFPQPAAYPASRLYRRWAFESAALDLALGQAGLSLGDALGRKPAPLSFVVSMGLGEPPELTRLRRWRELYPAVRFKLDPTGAWTDAVYAELIETGAVATADLKGRYSGPYAGTTPSPELYRRVAEAFPDAWLEDPRLAPELDAALEPHRDRITWDAPLHSAADILQLPFQPSAINVKPSRFGFLSELMRVYDYCEARGIRMYGGGQFELGPGRGQIQLLASLFHPDAPNDVAPSAYNHPEPVAGLLASPLAPRPSATGFRWED